MQLTQKQSWLIDRYLRTVAVAVDPAVDHLATERLLTRLRRQIEGELARLDPNALSDDAVRDAIDHVGPADVVVRELLAPKEAPVPTAATRPVAAAAGVSAPGPAGRWLGVCGCVADRLEIPAWVMRTLAVLLGLGTGPVALAAYAAIFLWLRATGSLPGERIRWWRLIWRPVSLTVVIAALYAGARYALVFAAYAMDTWVKRPMPRIGEWGWFLDQQHAMLIWTLILALPVAVLGALPMAGGWDKTLHRLSQALAALYAIAICFGLASVIVGVVLQFAGELTGK